MNRHRNKEYSVDEIDLIKKERKGLLDNLLDSYTQPAFIVDDRGKIQAYNRSVTLELDIALDKYVQSISSLSFIEGFINSSSAFDEKELLIDNKYYLVNLSKFNVNDKLWSFISFSNISYIKAMQNQQINFIQDASHELKTAIAGIKGLCELIIDDKVNDFDKVKEFVEIIYNENNRLEKIVNRLTLTQANQINKSFFNINTLLNEVKVIYTDYQDKDNIELIISSNINDYIKSDQMIIKQLLVNIVENAFKYSENGSIEIDANLLNNNLHIKISDQGIGISKDELPFIFDRFYRVDHSRTRSTGGNGLGLSIVKQLVESLNGSISVNSKVNKGTSFIIIIPIDMY